VAIGFCGEVEMRKGPLHITSVVAIGFAATVTAGTVIAYVIRFGANGWGNGQDWANFGNYLGGILAPVWAAAAAMFLIQQLRDERATRIWELRAYVHIELPNIYKIVDKPRLNVHGVITNIGKTPARVKLLTWHVHETPVEGTSMPVVEYKRENFSILPGKQLVRNTFLDANQQKGETLYHRVEELRAEVKVVYEDIFGDEHHTSVVGLLHGHIRHGVTWQLSDYQAD
jgi:hypothetical protein